MSAARTRSSRVPAELASDIFKISARKNHSVSDALSNDKLLKNLRAKLHVQHIDQLAKLADLLDQVHLTNLPDAITWRFGIKEVYSAKSAYMLQSVGSSNIDFRKQIWKGWVPSRCKFGKDGCLLVLHVRLLLPLASIRH